LLLPVTSTFRPSSRSLPATAGAVSVELFMLRSLRESR
jgi:hypothetical protein